jgi:hypothetical protein
MVGVFELSPVILDANSAEQKSFYLFKTKEKTKKTKITIFQN